MSFAIVQWQNYCLAFSGPRFNAQQCRQTNANSASRGIWVAIDLVGQGLEWAVQTKEHRHHQHFKY